MNNQAAQLFRHFSLILAFSVLFLRTWCQTVQDEWTAPAAPDGSTPLQSGTRFTLLWKSSLQNSFQTYCPLCDTTKLDLWITNFNGTKYTSKIGRGIDITTTTSYDWNVNIASTDFSEKAFWVFRFTFFGSSDPYTQQISSPGFKISGLVKASSTITVQTSGATSTIQTSFSFTTTSTNIASLGSSSNTPQPTEQTTAPESSSKGNTWIAGVVAGPIIGIALGAALTWYCLRKRKSVKAQQQQEYTGYNQSGHYSQYPPSQNTKQTYYPAVVNVSQPSHQADDGHHVAEAPDRSPPPPAELWQGNYRS